MFGNEIQNDIFQKEISKFIEDILKLISYCITKKSKKE